MTLPFALRPTATSTRSYSCGSAGAFAPSKPTLMPAGVASADTVFVFSITLSKRGAFFFSHTLTRSRSAPAIMPSSISTTSMRVPSVEYTVAISRPMMPPPITSIRFGIDFSSSAPVESTTRGSSGMNGSFTAWLPAAMIAFWKRMVFFSPVLSWPVPDVSSTST